MSRPCSFIHFGLIVTGKTEAAHLPNLFRSLMATGMCHVQVIRLSGQRAPRTSSKKRAKMVRSGKSIPTKDEQEIGLPARRYLHEQPCRFVILIDDLEHDRRSQAQQLFDRYRLALDTMLTEEQQHRAAVHFLVNMLEAYYFADAQAVNQALGLTLLTEDYPDDVETIRHPKRELKKLYPTFREIEDGAKILERLNVEHVLSAPNNCAWLRTLFAWCVKALERHPHHQYWALSEQYQLPSGKLSDITRSQLDHL